MIALILAGIVYAVWAESLPVAVITAALVLYRAQRPSTFWSRLRDARYRAAVLRKAEEDDPLA